MEGRNAQATMFEIYFKDPFLAYVYVGSIPFFVGLHRAFGMLGRVRRDRAFSQSTVDALRGIRRCAMAIIGFAAVGEIFIILRESDDRAGGVFMGLLVICGSATVAAMAAMFARQLNHPPGQSEGSRSRAEEDVA